MGQTTCQTCGEQFTPRASGGKPQVRCSASCRRKVANANYIKKNAPARATACRECGGPVIQAASGRPREFCADTCKQRFMNRAARRRWLPARDPDPPARNCAHCGTSFKPRRKDQIYCPTAPGSFCAQKAYAARVKAGEPLRQVEQTKTCVECDSEFTALQANAKWCSSRCRNRTTSREASRRRGGVRSNDRPYADREIFARDGWICQICHEPVDPDLPRTHREGATIDHVIPLSMGGSDAPDNVVTAHTRCNLAKGSMVRPADLAAWLVREHPDLVTEAVRRDLDGLKTSSDG